MSLTLQHPFVCVYAESAPPCFLYARSSVFPYACFSVFQLATGYPLLHHGPISQTGCTSTPSRTFGKTLLPIPGAQQARIGFVVSLCLVHCPLANTGLWRCFGRCPAVS